MSSRTLLLVLACTLSVAACDSPSPSETGAATFLLEAGETARARGLTGYEVTVVDEYQTILRVLGAGDEVLGTASVRVEPEGSHWVYEPADGGPVAELRLAEEGPSYLVDGREIARFERGEAGSLEPVGEIDVEGDHWEGFSTLMAAVMDHEVQGFLPSVVGFTWWTTTDDCDASYYSMACNDCGAAYCGPLMYVLWPWLSPYCHAQCVGCAYCSYAAF